MEESEGKGRLLQSPDVDALRAHFGQHRRPLAPKVMSAREAVARYVRDGDYLAVGGFSTNRRPMALLHEVVRQRKKNLGFAGHSATHDFQVLAAGGCIDRCDVAYVVGLEARGLSKNARRLMESGRVEVVEWSNAALAWRFHAAAMGVPFLPARVMLGTETFARSAAKEITCPFTGTRLVALPALSPDVALIHVHRCDEFGNAQIDGITVCDLDIARAAKRLVTSTERLVSTEAMRREPQRTAIPYYLVDAVVEAPFGAYPCNMPGEYFSDEPHLQEWLKAESDEVEFAAFLDRYIYDLPDFQSYLKRCCDGERLARLRAEELLTDEREGA